MSEQKIAPVLSDDEIRDVWLYEIRTEITNGGEFTIAARAIEQVVLARAGAVREQKPEPMYQIKFHYDEPSGWHDATEHAYDLHPTEKRRIVYAAPDAILALKDTPAAAVAKPSAALTMTVAQVRQLLKLSAGDDVSDDAESEVSVCRGDGADGHRLYFWVTDYPEEGAMLLDGVEHCDKPPHGWRCTRSAGHFGPCAAVEAPEDIAVVERAMQRMRNPPPQPSTNPGQLAAVERDADRENCERGRAIDWACRDLPEGWRVRIELENGSATAYWLNPYRGLWHHIDNDEDFSDQVKGAIDAAIAASKEGARHG